MVENSDGRSFTVRAFIRGALTDVEVPAEFRDLPVSAIGERAFYDCRGLKSIVLPKRLRVIGGGTFAGCSSLTSIVVPDGVKEIGINAFEDCSSLTSIVIPASVEKIDVNAFYPTNKLTISAPKGSCAEEFAKKKKINFKPLD